MSAKIFLLDGDPEQAGEYHCDAHLYRKTRDYAWMLSHVAKKSGFYAPDRMYVEIPEGQVPEGEISWLSESIDNYVHTLKLARKVGEEYKYRYGWTHPSYRDVLSKINLAEVNLPDVGFTDPVYYQVDEYNITGDYIRDHRHYYSYGIGWDMRWTKREVPDWYNGGVIGEDDG